MTGDVLNLPLDPTRPLYAQIVEGITRLVVQGEVAPGAGLPSVRLLAEQLRINPNTVQRAYRELEATGVVETRPGQGTFVRQDAARLSAVRDRLAADIVATAVQELRNLGLHAEEIERRVSEAVHATSGDGEPE